MAFDQGTAFPSAARTATPTPVVVYIQEDVDNLEVVIDTSAIGAAPSTVVNIDMMNADGVWQSYLASPAIVAVGTARLRIGPLVASTANVSAPSVLPKAVRIRPVHGNANSHTYSISYWVR